MFAMGVSMIILFSKQYELNDSLLDNDLLCIVFCNMKKIVTHL